MPHPFLLALLLITLTFSHNSSAEDTASIGKGWAGNSVNAAIFRKNSVVSDEAYQFTSYYAPDGTVVIARRPQGEQNWSVVRTPFSGNIHDAHNVISIALDGDGFLHLSWDHHDNELRYTRSLEPHSLDFHESCRMVGTRESSVTYPEFHSIGNGDLLFLYRDGESGRGNLVINRYETRSQSWTRIQTKLIDGEQTRNAYWQAHADPLTETVHLSWTWRETWDVSTNHDICYAVSHDGGKTWQRSDQTPYILPITAATAEYAALIPQGSELINQTSMCADAVGRPYIASYWTPAGTAVPQFHLVYFSGESWETKQITNRTTPFSLSGGGTKRIPISRPQILADSSGPSTKAYLVFRDAERGNRPSLASCQDLSNPTWTLLDLSEQDLGQWEPSYDISEWHRSSTLSLFLQSVGQGDGETTEAIPPQAVSILTYKPE